MSAYVRLRFADANTQSGAAQFTPTNAQLPDWATEDFLMPEAPIVGDFFAIGGKEVMVVKRQWVKIANTPGSVGCTLFVVPSP